MTSVSPVSRNLVCIVPPTTFYLTSFILLEYLVPNFRVLYPTFGSVGAKVCKLKALCIRQFPNSPNKEKVHVKWNRVADTGRARMKPSDRINNSPSKPHTPMIHGNVPLKCPSEAFQSLVFGHAKLMRPQIRLGRARALHKKINTTE